MKTQSTCAVSGCPRLGVSKGYSERGQKRWSRYCQFHEKARSGLPPGAKKQGHILNRKCEACGWDKAPCDRHRVKPEIGYTIANVRILCPNCHRLETLGMLNPSISQFEESTRS